MYQISRTLNVSNIKNHEKIEVMKFVYLIFDKNWNISDGEFAHHGFSWEFKTDHQQTNDFKIQHGKKKEECLSTSCEEKNMDGCF